MADGYVSWTCHHPLADPTSIGDDAQYHLVLNIRHMTIIKDAHIFVYVQPTTEKSARDEDVSDDPHSAPPIISRHRPTIEK